MMKTHSLTLAMLLLVTTVSCANETTEINSENQEASWWEKTKQAVADMWSSTPSADNETETKFLEEKDSMFAEIWESVTPALDEVLILEKEAENLPDSTWFGKDRTDNQHEINDLLDEAVDILSLSNSTHTRQRIRALEEDIRQMKQTISEYRQAQVSAPIRSTWKTTVADYEAKIEQLNELIEQRHEAINELKIQFTQELSEKGLHITPEQLDVLLSSVVGDDILQSSIIYNNVKQISQQLMNLTIKSGEDFDISQRYYGMYTVLLKIVLHMQQRFLNNIDEKYLPKIGQIVADVYGLNATTRNLLRSEIDKNRRRHLQANLEAQKLTLQTAQLYKVHLIKQRRKIATAINKTKADLQIAQNTYKTVRVSGELINLLRTSQKSFDILLNIQVPDLLEFQNLQMKQEFAILTQKLAE
jgi:DNA-binding transcriptional regulator YbjK